MTIGTRAFAITISDEGTAKDEVRSNEASECKRLEVGLRGGEGKEGHRTTKSISLQQESTSAIPSLYTT